MELATKYALIPEEELSRHVPTKKQMTDFDLNMSKILNSSLPDHEKVQQYYKLLKRKMNLQEFNLPWKLNRPEEDEEKKESPKQDPVKEEPATELEEKPEKEDFDEFVVSSVPNPMKKQAEALLKLLKSDSSKMKWNRKGLITYKGETLQDTNLAELFHLIFCTNKKPPVKPPTEFLEALQEIGVPRSMIKNKYLSFQPKTRIVSPRNVFVKTKKRPTHVSKSNVLLKTWSSLY